MPRSAAELLELLARHHASEVLAPLEDPRPGIRFDLAKVDRLLDVTDADVTARIEARLAADPNDPLPALAAELRAFVGRDGGCALGSDLAAARGALVAGARRATGRARVLVFGGRDAGVEAPVSTIAFDGFAAAADAIAADPDLACLVLEPRGEPAMLSDLVARARAAGALVVLDESRTAGRLAPTTVAADLDAPCDAVLLGPSVACGVPFAAVVGALTDLDLAPPSPVAAEVALATCERLRAAPIADALGIAGAQLVSRFSQRCREEDVLAELAGPPALPVVRFAGQENAEAPLIAHHFQLELATLGAAAGADVAVPVLRSEVELDALCAAFEGAVSRIRTLLIEHNSWLSGGVPFVFPAGAPRLRERGIALYRHPKLAAVDVLAIEDRMRIAFAPGELGPVTSSGFYLPTRLRGDFEIEVHYEVRCWEPGPDSACLGLFVQNEPSTARYYAQLMSTANRPGERSAAAGLAGVLHGRRAVPGRRGWLRLTRRGDLVVASHRDADEADFIELGSLSPCSRDDVITGVKIWSKVRCGGLEVDLADLVVNAEIPTDQLLTLEARPDPRRAPHQGR